MLVRRISEITPFYSITCLFVGASDEISSFLRGKCGLEVVLSFILREIDGGCSICGQLANTRHKGTAQRLQDEMLACNFSMFNRLGKDFILNRVYLVLAQTPVYLLEHCPTR